MGAMDECAKDKAKEYPKQTQKIMGLMSKIQAKMKVGNMIALPTPGPAAVPKPPAPAPPAAPKPAKAPKLGLLAALAAAKKKKGLPAAKPVGIFIASGLLAGAVVAGAALLVQRRRQHNPAGARLIAE